MRDMLKMARRWLAVGWFWPLVLIVLPNCGFQSPGGSGGGTAGPNLNPGDPPHSSAVFCDIEKQSARHCASDDEIAHGIRLASAAIALNTGATSGFALDDSPDALARCAGKPEAVPFFGTFPEGFSVCVNCGQTVNSAAYPDNNALCAAQCEDFVGTTLADGTFVPANPPDPATKAFCEQHAHASTNFPLNGCFDNACLTASAIDPAFVDPRRAQEPVAWRDLIGVTASGNTLTKTAGSATFDASADSSQTIAAGDAYVDFSSGENATAKFAGLSTGGPPDTDSGFTHIGFAIELSSDRTISVWESGAEVAHQVAGYSAGDHFRVNVHANADGTASITYTRIVGTCNAGSPCNEQPVFTSTAKASYPFRVDTSFEDLNSTLTAQLVRIH